MPFFQKIKNPIKSKKSCDCFTSVSNFLSISQAVDELSGFETLQIGRTHTYIRMPAKNHISRRFRLFWVLWH